MNKISQQGCLLILLVLSAIASSAAARPTPEPQEVLDKIARQYSMMGRYAEVSMNVVRDSREEFIQFEVFSADEQRLRLEVSNPPRIKGSAIVRSGQNLWVSMPRI